MFRAPQEGIQNGNQLPGSTSRTGELYGRRHYRRVAAADRAAFPAVRRLQRAVRRASSGHLSRERKRVDRVAGWIESTSISTVKHEACEPSLLNEPVNGIVSLAFIQKRKRERAPLDMDSRSSNVRKSMVLNSRSSAGRPQMFAPIERYARSSLGGWSFALVESAGSIGMS